MKYKLFLIAVILVNSLLGQWKIGVSNYSFYDSNLYKNYRNNSDSYIIPGIDISRSGTAMDFYVNGYSILMNKNKNLNNVVGTFGMDYYKKLSDDLYSNFGMNVTNRINQPEYDYYDYFKISTQSALKWYSMDKGLTRIYFKIHNKSFSYEESWNHIEYTLKLQQNFYFTTGTTLRFEAEPIIRDFLQYSYQYNYITYQDELPTLWQSKLKFRVAQSLSDNFGGYTEFLYRYNPSKTNPYDPLIQSFSPIDDYFGYGGYEWHSQLKYKLSESLWLTTSAELYRDIYKNRAIYDYDFETDAFSLDDEGYYIPIGKNREDTGFIMDFSISYRLSKLFNSPSQLYLNLKYSNQVNESNDGYYDYENNSVSLQLNYNTQF